MLNRATTIAHETSHMWFGDLVTMQWFNDVWMKEVFANFMAAKIVNPAFPNVNHDLRFLVSHYPAAYAVDRTAGTHPIRQELANLDEAGSLYGTIIYDKAPIVMRQLERILGPDKLQNGLQAYLKQYQFGNATWLDLIKILGSRSDTDLTSWSHAWVEEAGRPSIRTVIQDPNVAFVQSDPQPGRSLKWTEQLDVLAGNFSNIVSVPVELHDERTDLKLPAGISDPQFILPTGGGLGYGDFTLDDSTRSYLLQHLPEFKDPLTRGAAWVTLWEEMLDRRIAGVRVRFQRDGRSGEGRYRTEYSAAGRVSRRCLLDLPDRRSAEGCRAEARAGAANRYRSDEIVHHEGDLFLRFPLDCDDDRRSGVSRTRLAPAAEDSGSQAGGTRRGDDGARTRGPLRPGLGVHSGGATRTAS